MADARPTQNRNWIWYFLALVVLTIAAAAIPIWYNSGQQLTEEKLQAAWKLWKEQGPRDYNLSYSIKREGEEDSYEAQVRSGQAVSVARNGQPVEKRLYHYSDMNALFRFIEEFFAQDNAADPQSKRRVFAVARFDDTDGHLLHYVRSVSISRQRVEITVTQCRGIEKK